MEFMDIYIVNLDSTRINNMTMIRAHVLFISAWPWYDMYTVAAYNFINKQTHT